jgi:CRISPR/Cas system-associated exonuclease Cas4 (RecB family)
VSERFIVDTEKMTIAQKRFDVKKLAELINDSYLNDRRGPNDRAKKSFAPSGIGYGAGTCPRRWFYDFQGGTMREDDVDSTGVANMSYGTEAHARLQKVFENAGILVEAERKVISERPPVYGFADLVIDWQGEEVVGEIKTTSQESFVSKKAKNQPAGYHLLQVLIYMRVRGLNKGFIIYENKNTQALLILPVTWNVDNTKLADDTFEWMQKVYDNAMAGTKPKRPFKSSKSVVCKTCPFKTTCWEDEEGVVDLPVLEIPK